MPERLLIENCSPTLAGMKPANLISILYNDPEMAKSDIREMNRIFVGKGLRAVPLSYRKQHVLLYIYRPEYLTSIFRDKATEEFLETLGYDCSNADECVNRLGERIRSVETSDRFPHEIGVFLGYPLEDVKAFINHKNEGCKCVGFWRVYGDEQRARKTFEGYRNCTNAYLRTWERGWSLERLTVKVQAG